MNSRPDDEAPGAGPMLELGGAPKSGSAAARRDDRPGREPGDLVVALSPQQILGGFALLAALIVFLKRRAQGKG